MLIVSICFLPEIIGNNFTAIWYTSILNKEEKVAVTVVNRASPLPGLFFSVHKLWHHYKNVQEVGCVWMYTYKHILFHTTENIILYLQVQITQKRTKFLFRITKQTYYL